MSMKMFQAYSIISGVDGSGAKAGQKRDRIERLAAGAGRAANYGNLGMVKGTTAGSRGSAWNDAHARRKRQAEGQRSSAHSVPTGGGQRDRDNGQPFGGDGAGSPTERATADAAGVHSAHGRHAGL